MAQKILALCDSNIHYGSRLAEYLEHQRGFPLRVVFFSDTGSFMQYASVHAPPYLIVSEDMFAELSERECFPQKKLFVLCRQAPGSVTDGMEQEGAAREQAACEGCGMAQIIRIYRYQPAGGIMRTVLSELDEETIPEQKGRGMTGEGTKIIGVFTPVGRSMQTSFSVTLGQFLAKRGRTLYINMEGCSGFRTLFGRDLKPDITDLMLFAEKEKEQFMKQLERMIDTIGGLEYIPPASVFTDLAAVTQEQWLKVLRDIQEDGRFSYLVLDVTQQIQGMFAVLDRCGLVYTIEGADRIAKAKLYEYEKLLEVMEYDRILKKTKKLRLPGIHFANVNFEQLIYSELAEYVRGLVERDIGEEMQ